MLLGCRICLRLPSGWTYKRVFPITSIPATETVAAACPVAAVAYFPSTSIPETITSATLETVADDPNTQLNLPLFQRLLLPSSPKLLPSSKPLLLPPPLPQLFHMPPVKKKVTIQPCLVLCCLLVLPLQHCNQPERAKSRSECDGH